MRPFSHAFYLKGWWYQHQNAAENGLFAFYRQGANDAANGPRWGRTHIPMRLLTSQRGNLLGVFQERANEVM